jgi:glyoxylase-like metal-dependent hydrolase (beta-lactamase superfamily II)
MGHNGTTRWTIGAIEVTRVADPDFELVLPQDDATAAILKATPWLCPDFVTDEQALRIGSSAIAIRTLSATIVVDPFLAFDDPARLAPRLAALRAARVDPDEVDIVVNTHIDGIGANVLADGAPAFPTARYVLPAAELEDARAGVHADAGAAIAALADIGMVDGLAGGERLVPGVHVEDAPGHNRGNVVVWIESGGTKAVVVGHLFLHPAQIANPDIDNGDLDPVVLARTRRALLSRCVEDDAVLVGPLFAAPGGGKVRQEGDTWRLQALPGA